MICHSHIIVLMILIYVNFSKHLQNQHYIWWTEYCFIWRELTFVILKFYLKIIPIKIYRHLLRDPNYLWYLKNLFFKFFTSKSAIKILYYRSLIVSISSYLKSLFLATFISSQIIHSLFFLLLHHIIFVLNENHLCV